MSLIHCPECSKEISNKAITCPNCGFPLNNMNGNNVNVLCNINEKIYNLDEALQLSLNGKYKEAFISISKKTNLSIKNCLNILEQIKVLDEVPETYTIKEYTKNEEKEAGVIIFSMKDNKTKQSNAPVTCPKCGCTEVVPLRRKFSLLTGFATNKVDIVCSKCGTKIK